MCERFDTSKADETRKRFYTNKSLNKTSVKEMFNEEPKISSGNCSKNAQPMVKLLTLQESIGIQQVQAKILKVKSA